MILEALCDFYRHQPDINLPPFGFEEKQIPFIVVINPDGEFVRIEDTRKISSHGKSTASAYLVPKAVKRSSAIAANLLWDVAEYALGLDVKKNPEKTAKQHMAFIEKLRPYSSIPGVESVLTFLTTSRNNTSLFMSRALSDIHDTNPLVSFKVDGENHLVCQSQPFIDAYNQSQDHTDDKKLVPCLVTGKNTVAEKLHPSIRGLFGAQSSGANVVSFNLAAFTSWNKKQGDNAAVDSKAVFEYTTALNYLLSKKNSQQFRIGNSTYLFWSDKQIELISFFQDFFISSFENADCSKQISRFYEDFQLTNKIVQFYVLGFTPNNARIAVSLWHNECSNQLASKFKQWLEDIYIKGVETFGFPCLANLLKSTVLDYKEKYLPDRLTNDVIRAILENSSLPCSFAQNALQRIRFDGGKVSYLRASLLKAYMNRLYRSREQSDMQLKTDLDEENSQVGYVLGRLFAVFERLQTEAHRSNLNTTIASRYYSGASIRPQTVFSALYSKHIYHLRKLKNPGRAINFQKMVGELSQKLVDIPSYINSEQQCLFAVGYYHQRQMFYTSQSEVNPESNDEGHHDFEESL